jgi:hypothetical protein
MKTSLLIIAVLFSTLSNAQLQFAGSDGIPRNLEFHDADGNLIPIGEHADVNGSPMLRDQWAFGVINFTNGTSFTDTAINFSLFDHKLFFKRDNKAYPVKYPVKDFTLNYTGESGEKIIYQFRSGYPAIDKQDGATLYALLCDGKTFQLLNWEYKKIAEVQNYGGGLTREFALVKDYYVYLPGENKLVELGIRPTLDGIKKILVNYAGQIAGYNSAHKFNARKEEDLVQLFSYLNSAK